MARNVHHRIQSRSWSRAQGDLVHDDELTLVIRRARLAADERGAVCSQCEPRHEDISLTVGNGSLGKEGPLVAQVRREQQLRKARVQSRNKSAPWREWFLERGSRRKPPRIGVASDDHSS